MTTTGAPSSNNGTISLIDENNNFRTLSPTSTTPLNSGVTTFESPEPYRGTHSHDDSGMTATVSQQQTLWDAQSVLSSGHSNKELHLTSPYGAPDIKPPRTRSQASPAVPQRSPVVTTPLPDNVDSTYSFISNSAVEPLFDALSQTLQLMGADTSRVGNKAELQAIRYDAISQTVLLIHINLFTDTRPTMHTTVSSPIPTIVVEVQRRHGPLSNFDVFYHLLITELRSFNGGQFNGKPLQIIRPFDTLPLSSTEGVNAEHELDRLVLTKWRAVTSDRIRDARASLIGALAIADPTVEDLTHSLKLISANMKHTLPHAAQTANSGTHSATQTVDIQRPYLALLLLNNHVLNNAAFIQSEELHQFMTHDSQRQSTLIDQLIALLVCTRTSPSSPSPPSLTLLTNQTVAALTSLAQSHYAYVLQSQPIVRERLVELADDQNIDTQLRQSILTLLSLF